MSNMNDVGLPDRQAHLRGTEDETKSKDDPLLAVTLLLDLTRLSQYRLDARGSPSTSVGPSHVITAWDARQLLAFLVKHKCHLPLPAHEMVLAFTTTHDATIEQMAANVHTLVGLFDHMPEGNKVPYVFRRLVLSMAPEKIDEETARLTRDTPFTPCRLTRLRSMRRWESEMRAALTLRGIGYTPRFVNQDECLMLSCIAVLPNNRAVNDAAEWCLLNQDMVRMAAVARVALGVELLRPCCTTADARKLVFFITSKLWVDDLSTLPYGYAAGVFVLHTLHKQSGCSVMMDPVMYVAFVLANAHTDVCSDLDIEEAIRIPPRTSSKEGSNVAVKKDRHM